MDSSLCARQGSHEIHGNPKEGLPDNGQGLQWCLGCQLGEKALARLARMAKSSGILGQKKRAVTLARVFFTPWWPAHWWSWALVQSRRLGRPSTGVPVGQHMGPPLYLVSGRLQQSQGWAHPEGPLQTRGHLVPPSEMAQQPAPVQHEPPALQSLDDVTQPQRILVRSSPAT